MSHYRIARLDGDGIGPDVIAEAVRVLEVELCRAVDAILFGAAGLPDIRHADGTELTPQVSLRMILDLYASMRPVKLYGRVPSPLRLPPDGQIDYVILRENTEGLFASLGRGVEGRRGAGRRYPGHHAQGHRACGPEAAVARALSDPRAHTRNLGGSASTRRCADAVIEAL